MMLHVLQLFLGLERGRRVKRCEKNKLLSGIAMCHVKGEAGALLLLHKGPTQELPAAGECEMSAFC